MLHTTTRKTSISENFLDDTFFLKLRSYFRTHPITLLLEILGRTDTWAVPSPQI